MTWSYDPSTPIGRIRDNIGDSIENSGPRFSQTPALTNFSDEQIQAALDRLDGSENRASRFLFHQLSLNWATAPVQTKVGDLMVRRADRVALFNQFAKDFGFNPAHSQFAAPQWTGSAGDKAFRRDLHANGGQQW